MIRKIFAMLLLFAVVSIALPTFARGAPPGDKQIAQHVVVVNVAVQTAQDLTAESGNLYTNKIAGDVTAKNLDSKNSYNANDESSGLHNTLSPAPEIVLQR